MLQYAQEIDERGINLENIAKPGVFPGFIAFLLAVGAYRAYVSYKKGGDKRFKTSIVLCVIGSLLFISMAVFQIME
ncbi:hypothetical protein LJC01_00725 [Clostridiaceae bacterium OttesenSCG-928-D20]|nr:hypothetical protein [Clostridiaceae bacterium OttesenSCG-928-D20]